MARRLVTAGKDKKSRVAPGRHGFFVDALRAGENRVPDQVMLHTFNSLNT